MKKIFNTILFMAAILLTLTGAAAIKENGTGATGTYMSGEGFVLVLKSNGTGKYFYLPWWVPSETYAERAVDVTWGEIGEGLSVSYNSSTDILERQEDGSYTSGGLGTLRKMSEDCEIKSDSNWYRETFRNTYGRTEMVSNPSFDSYTSILKYNKLIEVRMPYYWLSSDTDEYQIERTETGLVFVQASLTIDDYVDNEKFIKAVPMWFEKYQYDTGNIETSKSFDNTVIISTKRMAIDNVNYTVCTAFIRDYIFGRVISVSLYQPDDSLFDYIADFKKTMKTAGAESDVSDVRFELSQAA